jgi:hypothetical protein
MPNVYHNIIKKKQVVLTPLSSIRVVGRRIGSGYPLLQSISGVIAINPLVAFYDIHGGKRQVLFFYFVPDTTRDTALRSRLNSLVVIFATFQQLQYLIRYLF